MKPKSLWVVVPAFNEEERIKDVVIRCMKHANVVVVDDGSRDNTFDVAKSCNAVVLRHIINLGKGSALKTGCDFALSRGADAIVLIDSDGQHDPAEVPKLVNALESCEIVFGARRFDVSMPFLRRLGNRAISAAARVLYNVRLSDTQCGFKAFTADAYSKLRWASQDYSVESEIIAMSGKHHLKYCEVLIRTIYSDKYKGVTILNGIKIVKDMFWWRVSR